MIRTDSEVDLLLIALDAAAREKPWPAFGLPLYGTDDRRAELRVLVHSWLAVTTEEVKR